jgi:hypothetical protein
MLEMKTLALSLVLTLLVGICACRTDQPAVQLSDDQAKAPLISYWDVQRIGANYFNAVPTSEWFESAAAANIELIRLTYGKWKGEQRDFLMGNADAYRGLVEEDFKTLVKYLDLADSLGIRVVVTPLSLPGARWRQVNGMKEDLRLWTEDDFLLQAVRFWKDLAGKLKSHPAVVGYNLINEPHPEVFYGKRTFWRKGFLEWYDGVKGTAGDLNRFNSTLVSSIREVDTDTTIVVESGLWATPWAFEYLEPVDDDNVLYSFHMYEPYDYTTRRINAGRFSYPGEVEIGDLEASLKLNKEKLSSFFDPVREWAERHEIPPNRIWAGEFGCDRTTVGAEKYLRDLIDIFNSEQWHWSFYGYREDEWDSMDYELGTDRPGKVYWKAQEDGELEKNYDAIYGPRAENSLWSVFRTQLERSSQ